MGDVPTGPGMGGPPPPPIRSTCDSQACQSALAAVADDRNRVLNKCAQVEATRGRMNILAAIAATFATLAVAALVGAAAASGTFFGIPAAIVLLIVAILLASIALTFGTLAAIAAAQLAVQQAELNTERTRFSNDVSKVLAICPSTCWGDTSLPACPD